MKMDTNSLIKKLTLLKNIQMFKEDIIKNPPLLLVAEAIEVVPAIVVRVAEVMEAVVADCKEETICGTI